MEMSDQVQLRAGLQGDLHEDELICPKPQRVSTLTSCSPQLLKPVRQWNSIPSIGTECEATYEILDIFLSKNAYGMPSSFGFSPPYFCGSPPSRAGNPLVHNVEFVHQRRSPPPPMVGTEPNSLTVPSFRASPSIRIEGFDCSGQDSRCSVPALA